VKVDWLNLRRKVLYCLPIFAIINEKLIKEDRPMRVARSARRRRRSYCNIMATRGEAVIGEGRSLRRAPTHSSLLPSWIDVHPKQSVSFSKSLEYCQKWTNACGNMDLLQLPIEKLRKRVICESHFEQRFKLRKKLMLVKQSFQHKIYLVCNFI